MALSKLERTAQEFAAKLAASEQRALTRMARAYLVAAGRLEPLWRDAYLALQYAKAQGFDDAYLSGFIWREQRMAKMLADMGAIFEQVGAKAGIALASGQQEAVTLAGQSFAASMAAASVTSVGEVMGVLGASFPRAQFERMVGNLTDFSPVNVLAHRYGETGPSVIRQALLEGVANGDSPRIVGRRINKALGRHYGDATVLTRTEMLRVYRETTRGTYQANAKYVQGWIWNSALDKRTCPICYAMHGTKHPLGEPMATHPVCRCSMIPWLRPSPLIKALPGGEGQLGTDVFAALDEETKLAILGPSAYKAYSQGLITLPDLVGSRFSSTWGAGRYQRSLSSVLGPDGLKALRLARPIERLEERARLVNAVRHPSSPFPVSDAVFNNVVTELERLPGPIHDIIRQVGATADVVVDTGITAHETYSYLRGVKPRGWESTGRTWDTVPGSGGQQTTLVGNSLHKGHGSANLVLHEHAHTWDTAVGKVTGMDLSKRREWVELWQKHKWPTAYELNYPEEGFAESVARLFGTDEKQRAYVKPDIAALLRKWASGDF